MPQPLTDGQVAEYHREGYVIARGFYDREAIDLLGRAAREDRELDQHSFGRADGEGGVVRLSLWNHPGDGIYGMFARGERIVRSAERLLGGEVYHYHSKLTAKEPRVGGAWEWHQDYGYWYHNGCMFPYMASVMVALDKTTRENGCLQVLRGSHVAGRVDHGVLPGEQVGADPRRVEQMLKTMELVYAELDPGDGLFFHANLMHRSDQNSSDQRRWTVLFCYNAARNNPYLEHHHPQYTPLDKVSDDAVKAAGVKHAHADDNHFRKTFANPPELKKRLG